MGEFRQAGEVVSCIHTIGNITSSGNTPVKHLSDKRTITLSLVGSIRSFFFQLKAHVRNFSFKLEKKVGSHLGRKRKRKEKICVNVFNANAEYLLVLNARCPKLFWYSCICDCVCVRCEPEISLRKENLWIVLNKEP